MSGTGEALIEMLKGRVLTVMKESATCAPGGRGLTNRAIEEATGLGLGLPEQDGWVTWSILRSLVEDGEVERLKADGRWHWRLTGARSGTAEG